MMLTSLPKHSVHDGVLDNLRHYIGESGLRAGDRLPGESELAARLGVGRPAVREALRALEAVGAVETRKGVGRFVGQFRPEFYVRNFTTESLIRTFSERELMETRCLLEIVAIPEAVARLSDTDLEEIARLQDEMRQRVERGEPYAAEDFGMHRAILRHVDNRLLAAILDAVYALSEARLMAPEATQPAISPERSRVDLAEHLALTEAVRARDGQLAQQRLIDHFETTASRLGFAPSWRTLLGSSAAVRRKA
jgi:GntR family transcriptional regulator, transcriptional repressor for pyruvate dehydrogenase complex